ncbi:hypothetical protein GF312_07305 [Candidatus Poribacteria bacterium]|nr:hypothetical protein [Candidatus Poribacteria bacterium]
MTQIKSSDNRFNNISMREKWIHFLNGEDVGSMVSPLCDDWSLDIPYYWPYDEPDPFPPGSRHHRISQQMAMAGICDWDPTFLDAVPFQLRNTDIIPKTKREKIDGKTRAESRIQTPYGDLISITEHSISQHTVKPWLDSKEDYKKAIWLTRQQMDYDEDISIEDGKIIRKGMGDRGVLGTWFGPPIVNFQNREEIFYHMFDWPELFQELHEVTTELAFKKLETLSKVGFDYLFYCVSGTEWISPDFFRKYIMDNTRKTIKFWKDQGGFTLWHSCGHMKIFINEGFYNELKPEILETLSIPPVGDLPSLEWARKKLSPDIITKGNIPLNILLQGTEEEVRTEVRKVKEETKGYRHIIGLSDDLLHNTPMNNCLAFVDEAR